MEAGYPRSLKSTELTPPVSIDGAEDGYDTELFEDKKIIKQYLCAACKKVAKSPTQSECGHRFCQSCINKLQRESANPCCPFSGCNEPINPEEISRDHAARREIGLLKVFCLFKALGCLVTLPLKKLNEHLSQCEYALIDCIHKARGCTVRIQRRQLTQHLATDCIFRSVTCKFCKESYSKEEIDLHIKQCPEAPRTCPNHCGAEDIPQGKLESHLLKCPLQQGECRYKDRGCNFKGSNSQIQEHMSKAAADHLLLLERSHAELDLKYTKLERKCAELENEKSIVENKFQQQARELAATKEKVEQLEGKISKVETQSKGLEDKVRDSHKLVATQTDKMMRMEHDLNEKAKRAEIEECKRLSLAVQETCGRLDERVDRLETQRIHERSGSGGVHAADIDEMRKTLSQIGTQLGMHDVRLAEQDLRFQVLETACYDGILIWKIKDYTRRKHEAVVGKTLSLYSQPFYTSKYGYKMCARVYLNGDGMGKGTHMSLFFVVMRGDYDSLLTWPFRQKVTLVLLDQDTGRRNLSDTFRPDPTSSSFKRPSSDMNIASGCPLFVSQSVLETPTYVKNDTLYIKVIVDTSDLYGP